MPEQKQRRKKMWCRQDFDEWWRMKKNERGEDHENS